MSELLLEIGCEEIPASWLPGLREQLQKRFAEAAAREHLSPSDVVVHSTPRRFALFAEVRPRQEDREEAVFGPSLKVARDAAGAWSGAAIGFARKNGTTPDALQSAAKDPQAPEDLHLLFVKKIAGRASAEVLPGVLAATLRALSFPKRMSWDAWLEDGKGAFPFARPIRWIVALLDGVVVPFTVYEMVAGAKGPAIVESGNATRGHRFLPRGGDRGPIPVQGAADFRRKLRDAFVILDPAEREVRIREGLAAAGEVRDDHGLIEEWRELVEYPTVVSGSIPAEFATLPTEVLETVLVHHQKYIPLAGEGRAASRFAALTGADETASAAIVRGMERVVVARLRDGAFFFREDRKRALADRVSDLAGVTFHQKLGSYREKADRMGALVSAMAGPMGLLTAVEAKAAQDAALLAKADLTTLMVREFPELQGIMGGIYLRAEGQVRDGIAAAVQWHYHPISLEEHSPPLASDVGDPNVFGAVSLADKLDTLAGYFGIGLQPSGSSDPFALRRAGQGVVRVLADYWMSEPRPNLEKLVVAAIEGYKAANFDQTFLHLIRFLEDRLIYLLTARGFEAGEIAAVIAAEKYGLWDVHDCVLRVQALHQVRLEAASDFGQLAIAFKRVDNILEKSPSLPPVREELLRLPAEKALFETVSLLEKVGGSYEERLVALRRLRVPVDAFFDEVLVMDKDEELRLNRMALLAQARSLCRRIADISKLGG